MSRVHDTIICFFGSLGLALLVFSIVLVPQNRLLADPPDPGGGGEPVPGDCITHSACNLYCVNPQYPYCETEGTCKITMDGCRTCKCKSIDVAGGLCECTGGGPF